MQMILRGGREASHGCFLAWLSTVFGFGNRSQFSFDKIQAVPLASFFCLARTPACLPALACRAPGVSLVPYLDRPVRAALRFHPARSKRFTNTKRKPQRAQDRRRRRTCFSSSPGRAPGLHSCCRPRDCVGRRPWAIWFRNGSEMRRNPSPVV